MHLFFLEGNSYGAIIVRNVFFEKDEQVVAGVQSARSCVN